ncbi:packaged DNA stabilization protein [Pseudoxanthomonas sp. USHLN014]|uniref:packaged DNA stabilization protein n=1 Tax=Pseudoxanthomonas sp. USHLN014 TaxID=3081297 RepID=UPI00301C1D07
MQFKPIDLLGGYYKDSSLPYSTQDTVNWLPELPEAAGTRTPFKLASPPGLRQFAKLGSNPVRGAINVEGALFVVAGNELRQVKADGTSTLCGTVPGVGRVSMAYNQITNGNQLLIVTGQSSGYVYNTATGTFSVISDDAYPGAKAAAYLDSYLLQVEPFGRYWFFSDLADALSYSSLDRMESEASPDKIVTLTVSQFEVVVFNQTTIEFFSNVGAETGTFQNKRILVERGCASGQTVVKLDNSIMWLGDDGVIYRLDGYNAIPISTGVIQTAIKGNNWSQAFAFKWEDGKHKVYYITFPDGHTWGYDVVTKLWHRRESYGLRRWRLNTLVRWNNMWIGGDFQDGRLWAVDWDYMLEGDQPLVSERVSGVVHDNQNRINVNYLELLMGMGTEETVAPAETYLGWERLTASSHATFDADGSLLLSADFEDVCMARSVSGKSFGKWQVEIVVPATDLSLLYGIVDSAVPMVNGRLAIESSANSYAGRTESTQFWKNGSASYPDLHGAGEWFLAGDVVGICLDLDAMTLTYYCNGALRGQVAVDESGLVWHIAGGNSQSDIPCPIRTLASQIQYPIAGYKPLDSDN